MAAYTTVTLEALQTALTDRVDGSVYWEAEESRLAWNETLALWNLLTGRWRRTVTIDLVANQTAYDLPSTLLYGMRVATQGLPVWLTSLVELDLAVPLWRSARTTDGGSIPARAWFWAPVSLTQIALYPTPAANLTNGMTVEGVSATPVLVEAADTLDLAEEDQDPLEDFALHLLAFKEGGMRWAATLPAFDALLTVAAEINGTLKAHLPYRRFAGLDRRKDLARSQRAQNRIPLIAATVEPDR